jgi:superfamily II DNA or RNA helicase
MATQPDIVIEHINASYIKLHTSESIKYELSEFYTFEIPGAAFMAGGRFSKHARGNWDGKIRLFNRRTSELPTGLISNLKESFCKPRGYGIADGSTAKNFGDDGLHRGRSVSEDSIRNFIDGLDIRDSNGGRITCRPDQLDAIRTGIQECRSLILSPTASGKTLIGYVVFQWMRHHYPNSKGLIIVPRIQLVDQLCSDWCSFSKSLSREKGRLQSEDFHAIYGGREPLGQQRAGDNRIVISTWQSIYKLPGDVFGQFDYILGDEAHEFKAKSLSHIMNSCVNAHFRLGLTGTLDGTNTHKLVLEGLFGGVTRVATSRELMDRGHIAKLKPIKMIVLKHPVEECKKLRRLGDGSYEAEISFLFASEARNSFITNLALAQTKNTLVLFQRVETHGHILHDMIRDVADMDRKIFYIHGGVEADEREKVRAIFEKETNAIILASYGTFSTGINIRNLHNVIFASPTKARIRNLQSIGRGLRLSDGKDSTTLFDISDDLRGGTNGPANFTYRHMEERLKIYIEEKFPYKMFPIDLYSKKDGLYAPQTNTDKN